MFLLALGSIAGFEDWDHLPVPCTVLGQVLVPPWRSPTALVLLCWGHGCSACRWWAGAMPSTRLTAEAGFTPLCCVWLQLELQRWGTCVGCMRLGPVLWLSLFQGLQKHLWAPLALKAALCIWLKTTVMLSISQSWTGLFVIMTFLHWESSAESPFSAQILLFF